MSKSFGNVVDPSEIIEKYGADTARLFMLFTALPEKELEWNDQGVNGAYKFLNRCLKLTEEIPKFVDREINNKDKFLISKQHSTIKIVTEYMNDFKFSLAIGKLMNLTNHINKYTDAKKSVYEDSVKTLALLIAPFVPHTAEEMWEKIGGSGFISTEKWPVFDNSKIDKKAEAAEDAVSELLTDISNVLKFAKISNPKKITLFVSEEWKYEFFDKLKETLSKTRNIGEIIKTCMIKEHEKEVSKLIPMLIKNESRIPKVVIRLEEELENINQNISLVKDQFNCEVLVVKADDSTEGKAKQAIPSKPAILVE